MKINKFYSVLFLGMFFVMGICFGVNESLILPSEVTFDSALAGSKVEKTFVVQNKETNKTISGISLSHNLGILYGIKFFDGNVELNTFSLVGGATKNITVKGILPADSKIGKSKIGDIGFAYGNVLQVVPLNVQIKSPLEITSIELNGKNDGEFKMGKSNKIEVEVKNNGNITIKDVEIKVTIKDIDDGDDLDEESDEFDLSVGEKEEESLKFKIDSYLDEEDYEVEIEVSVDGDKVLESTKTFDVDREKHDVKIKSTTFPSLVSCNPYPSLSVNIENQGEKDEDEVVVKVSNSLLSINSQKSNIELDDFSGSDNTYRVYFPLDLSSVAKGSYQLLVQVYRDETKLEDSKTIDFIVGACVTTAVKSSSYISQKEIIQKLKQKPITQPVNKVNGDESLYFGLLVGLVCLLVIAIGLGIVLLVKK